MSEDGKEGKARTKLEELFNMAPVDEVSDIDESASFTLPEPKNEDVIEGMPMSDEMLKEIEQCSTALDKINNALPQIENIGGADEEYDFCKDKALALYVKLNGLLENVEDRFAATVAASANQALKTAVDATNAKVDRKLKMVQLQVQQEKVTLEREKVKLASDKFHAERNAKKSIPSAGEVKTEGRLVSRESLLSGESAPKD